ncbi:Protein of unknown function [Gryllus bimaculatus]|nr:Protein of unknown function [Gryllus bimaculatus]
MKDSCPDAASKKFRRSLNDANVASISKNQRGVVDLGGGMSYPFVDSSPVCCGYLNSYVPFRREFR